jgi:hypothetical protein
MLKIQCALTVLALAAAACSSPAPETRETTETTAPQAGATAVPAEIATTVSAAAPGIAITSGELNAGGDEYEVTGRMPNGDEVEVDVVQTNGAWSVLEIQRDVPWSSVPEPVRAAAKAAPNSFEPVRVIESKQAGDGSVVFELFSAEQQAGGAAGGPAIEVRWHEDKATVITPAP